MPRRRSGNSGLGGCGCYILVILFNLAVGGLTFQYSLSSIFGKDVAWWVDVIAGAILAEITVPVAILCWIARLCGVEVPFIH
jgi:hypothetical protein